MNFNFRVFWNQQSKFECGSFELFSRYSFPLNWCQIQQWTGAVDKNNKKIYVGDLIKINDKTCEDEYLLDQKNEVVFDYFAFGLKTKDKVGNKQFSHLGNFEPKDLEIVGNIYE